MKLKSAFWKLEHLWNDIKSEHVHRRARTRCQILSLQSSVFAVRLLFCCGLFFFHQLLQFIPTNVAAHDYSVVWLKRRAPFEVPLLSPSRVGDRQIHPHLKKKEPASISDHSVNENDCLVTPPSSLSDGHFIQLHLSNNKKAGPAAEGTPRWLH